MKVAQIKDLASLNDKTVLGEITVKVDKVWNQKTGTRDDGKAWARTDMEISDSTGKSKATFWGDQLLNHLAGKTVTFRSQAGKRGLAGVTSSSYNGNSGLKLDDRCAILLDGENQTSALRGAAAPAPVAAPRASTALTVADVKKRLFQTAQLYSDSIRAARWVAEQNEIEDQETIRCITASLFISADKAGYSAAYPESNKEHTPAQALGLEDEGIPDNESPDDLAW